MQSVQLRRWGGIGIVAAIVIGVFLTMGYGIIGILFLLILAVLGGGALMSFLDDH
jgi:UDP-N-acetylmuramyl pentapeptide phosphotransferase/UDP-N-acetylglucosamine-1-phosphate transferase